MLITMVLVTRGVNIFIYLSFKLIGMELQKNKTKIKFQIDEYGFLIGTPFSPFVYIQP